MGFTLRSYEEIKAEFDTHVYALRGKHSADSVATLRHPRREQVQFLYAAITELDNYEFPAAIPAIDPDQERARVLSGLMLNIIYEINPQFLEVDSTSLFANALCRTIGISDENKLDNLSGAALLVSALNFYNAIVHINGDSRQPLRVIHPFTNIDPKKGEMHNEASFVIRANQLKTHFIDSDIRAKSVVKQQTIQDEKAASKPQSAGWFGFLGGGGTSARPTRSAQSTQRAGSGDDVPSVDVKDKTALETADSSSTHSGPPN